MEACVFHGNTSVGFGGCQISMETSPAMMAEEQLWLFWAGAQKEFQFVRSSSFWVPFLISWRHQYDTRYKDADCIPTSSQAGVVIWNSPSREAYDFWKKMLKFTVKKFFKIWNLPAWGVFKTLFAYRILMIRRWADLAGVGSVRPWKWSFNPRCSTGCKGHDGKTDLPKKAQLPSKTKQMWFTHLVVPALIQVRWDRKDVKIDRGRKTFFGTFLRTNQFRVVDFCEPNLEDLLFGLGRLTANFQGLQVPNLIHFLFCFIVR